MKRILFLLFSCALYITSAWSANAERAKWLEKMLAMRQSSHKIFLGHMSLQCIVPSAQDRLRRPLEATPTTVRGNVEVCVNGREVGVVWCSPWTIDLTGLIKKGTNHLLLRVSNVLANRMIGDAALPETERVTYSQPQVYFSNDQLSPSGIFGGDIKIERY